MRINGWSGLLLHLLFLLALRDSIFLALTFGRERNLTSEKTGEAQDISLNSSKDFVAGKNGRFHSQESKVEVVRDMVA